MACFPDTSIRLVVRMQALQPRMPNHGLGCSPFARHYLGNHYCFLFLRVLRCFSSPGALLPMTDDDVFNQPGCPIRKSTDHSLFAAPQAYRSLSRPSSPVHAKASSIRHNLLKSCHCTWFGLVPFFDALMSRYFVYNGYHVKPADRNRQTQHANFTFALSDIFQKTSLLYRVAYCATEQSLHQRTGQESYLSALA